MVKKKIREDGESPEPEFEKETSEEATQNFRLLVAIPATLPSHLAFRKQVLEAIEKACEGLKYDLMVGEVSELGWEHVVTQFNAVADRVISGGYDYAWFVEADVVPPPDALRRLLADGVDVASGVVKYHRYANKALDDLYKNIVGAGWFENPDNLIPVHNATIEEVEGRKLTFENQPLLEAGTGCLLVKRKVLEKVRFIYNFNYASYDVIFWRDIRLAGFTAMVDGEVFCEHLGE